MRPESASPPIGIPNGPIAADLGSEVLAGRLLDDRGAERDRERLEHRRERVEVEQRPLGPTEDAQGRRVGRREAGLGDDVGLRGPHELVELGRGRPRATAASAAPLLAERDRCRHLLGDLPVDRAVGLQHPHDLVEVDLREVEATRTERVRRLVRRVRAAARDRRRDPRIEGRRSRGQSMDVSDVAVTGIAGLLGQRLLPRLDASPAVGRVVGLDVRDPERRIGRLEMHRVDIATADLEPLLEGVERDRAPRVDRRSAARRLVRDAGQRRRHPTGARGRDQRSGITKIVRVSTAAVYGAWPGNPVPLTEDAPLRPNPGFGPAVQGAEVERMLAEWREGVPGAVTTTLRAAPVLGRGAEHLWARLLSGRPGDPGPGRGTAGPDRARRRRRRRAAARGRA